MSSLHTCYESKPFEFVVEGQSIYIHEKCIADVSIPLNNLISPDFAEGKAGKAELSGVDFPTFTRFTQWLYSDWYEPAAPTARLGEEENRPDPPWNEHLKPAKPFTELKQAFSVQKFRAPRAKTVRSKPQPNDPKKQDYTELLLSHAKLYVFADEKDIEALRLSVLRELHKTLSVFNVTADSIEDLNSMIRYAYENTPPRAQGKEPLRQLLSQFVGCNLYRVVALPPFKKLLAEVEGFADDFCDEIDEFCTKLRVSETVNSLKP